MKNILIPFTILLFIAFIACKKKESTPPETNTTTTTGGTTTSGTTTGGSYSTLQTTYLITNSGGVIAKDSSIQANFYSAPVTSGTYSLVSAGTVSLNSVNIPTIGGGIGYYIGNNAPVNLQLPLTWNVSGSVTLTAFSHSFVPTYPKFTGGNLMPDTCFKSAGITFTISGASNNPDNVVLIMLFSSSASALKYNFASNGTINFSAQDMASFSANSNLTIQVSWTNATYATYGGIKHCFTNNLKYIKYSYLKP